MKEWLAKLVFAGTLLLLVLAGGCAERERQVKNWNPEDYTVQSGDTLFSIAWRYEIDYRELAKWNKINKPYAIFPGQRIHTRRRESAETQSTSPGVKHKGATGGNTIVVVKGTTLYSLSKRSGYSVDQLAKWNHIKKPYTLTLGQRLTLVPPKISVSKKQPAKKPVTSQRIRQWKWPVKGKLLSGYGSSRSKAKGIDISGKTGDAVVAAARGSVVYSGNGLISYGNLLIIKHNNTYLSAYAHNSKLLVKEGDRVEAGQTIAELGRTGAVIPKLHFEIRKNGKPVNPLDYLPIK